MMNSYISPKQNRRFPNQPTFTSVMTQQQQPIVADQQYNQPLTQQSQSKKKFLIEEKNVCFGLASTFQGTPQRSMFRIFQLPPSRMVNSMNTQSTSSSYRR